jgi:hypothetical protein
MDLTVVLTRNLAGGNGENEVVVAIGPNHGLVCAVVTVAVVAGQSAICVLIAIAIVRWTAVAVCIDGYWLNTGARQIATVMLMLMNGRVIVAFLLPFFFVQH